MIPANTLLADTAAKPNLRLGFCYMPHGAVMSNWTPVMDGAGYTLSRTLAPLKSVQDSVLVLTGLGHRNAGSLGPGDSGGDHGRGPSVFLNASHPKRTAPHCASRSQWRDRAGVSPASILVTMRDRA
jgi:hypothetical protein